MAEGLGEVAQELSAGGIDLLSEQADVVDEGCRPFEDGAGPSRLSRPGQGLGQPEGAQKKRAFFALEPVVGPVAVHESPLIGETFFGRVDRGQHPGLVGRKEPDQRQHQIGSVELVRAEGLGERPGPVAPASRQDRLTDLVLGLLPCVDSVGGVESVG